MKLPERGGIAQRLSEGGEGVVGIEVHHGGAGAELGRQVDAELLDHVALHLGDGDFQHHLLVAADGDVVDDLLAVIDQARGDVERSLRLDRSRHVAVEHKPVAEALYSDIEAGKRSGDCGPQAVEIARHGDVEAGDLVAFGVEEINVGLPDRGADNVGAA